MTKETLDNIKRATWEDTVVEYKDHSNFYVGIAMGVMIVVCGAIYLVGSLMG